MVNEVGHPSQSTALEMFDLRAHDYVAVSLVWVAWCVVCGAWCTILLKNSDQLKAR